MRRPNRALCGIVLGLVIVGCAKMPKATDASVSAPAEPSAYPAPPPTAAGNGGPTAAPGAVELVQCRFDKVEAALAAARGKVVLVDCWARWCPPCVSSFPKLVEKNAHYGPRGLVCMSVSLDGGRKAYTPEQVLAFLKDKNATFQNFYLTDRGADAAAMDQRLGQISGIPHAVLFNKAGAKVWEGHPMDDGLVARIEAELVK